MALRKSVVLVTVDCLRADHCGFMGYERATTPFLKSLASESFVFPTAITGGAPTYYSFPSILASRYPLALGRDQLGLAPEEDNLASVLKKAGYATAAFCAGNPYLSQRFGYDQSFDRFEDFLGGEASAPANGTSKLASDGGWTSALNRKLEKFSHKLGPVGGIYDELYFQYCQRWASPSAESLDEERRFPAADVVTKEALSWLTEIGNVPFFLWLHLMDPHSPYYPTQAGLEAMGEAHISPFRARYLNCFWNRSNLSSRRLSRHREELVRLYDAGIRWVDTQVTRLLESLRNSGRWDDCIFAFTADHGEEFLDHGGRYHPPDRLYEELIHVPLLLRVPGTASKAISNAPWSQVHLAPTLLDTVGLSAPDSFLGRSHWQELQHGKDWEPIAIAESVAGCTNPFRRENRMGARVLAVREARYKLMLQFDPPQDRLYDLEADPREQSPLPAGADKPVRRHLLEVARNHLHFSIRQRDTLGRLRSNLRALQLEWPVALQNKQPVDS